jgi:hypothetical protein
MRRKKTTIHSNKGNQTNEIFESDEPIEFIRYSTKAFDKDKYNNKYVLLINQNTTIYFDFTVRRDVRLYYCSFPA